MTLKTEHVVEFLTELFQSGLTYSALNTARSALAALGTLLGINGVGERPLVKRLLRGVFQIRPAVPR